MRGRIAELAGTRAGQREAMGTLTLDDVLDLLVLARTCDQLAAAPAGRVGGMVDELSMTFPDDAPPALQPELILQIQNIPAACHGLDTFVRWTETPISEKSRPEGKHA